MSTDRRSSTQRALAVLDCFTTEAPTLTLSQIARRLGQPVSSTHRQLRELTSWGALERDASGRYAIGLHLWEVGALAPRSKSLREASIPFLEDLYEATHQNVQVAILDGNEVVYVERLFGHSATRIIARPGIRLPLHPTGVGRVLLAHAGVERINEVLSGSLKRYTEYTVVDPRALRRELAAVHTSGYAITDRQFERVSTSVAAPIRGADNSVIAALSIIVPSRDGTARGFAPAVVTAARGISRSLGAPLARPDAWLTRQLPDVPSPARRPGRAAGLACGHTCPCDGLAPGAQVAPGPAAARSGRDRVRLSAVLHRKAGSLALTYRSPVWFRRPRCCGSSGASPSGRSRSPRR